MSKCSFCGADGKFRGRVRDREGRTFCASTCQAAYAEIAWAAVVSDSASPDGRHDALRGLSTDRWGVPQGGPPLLQAVRAALTDLAARGAATPRDVLEQAQERADKDPADAGLHLELGLAYAQMPDVLPEAENALRCALDFGLESAKMRGVAHARLAQVYLRRGLAFAEERINGMSRADVLDAWRHLDGAVSDAVHPLNVIAPEFRLRQAANLKALACVEQWLEHHGGRGSKRFSLLVKGHAEDARKDLERHLGRERSDREAMVELGMVYRELGDIAAQQRLADKILRSRIAAARSLKTPATREPVERRQAPQRSFTQRCLAVLQNEGFEIERKEGPAPGELHVVARSFRPLFSGQYLVHCRDLDRPISQQDVLEFYGMIKAANALKGIVFSRSGYSKEAREWARGRELELMDDGVLRRLEEASSGDGQALADVPSEEEAEQPPASTPMTSY
jgi:tetratricopeptide (TPR) repeat protein